jgi:hypothetical protein
MRGLPIWQPLLRPIVEWIYAICRVSVRPVDLGRVLRDLASGKAPAGVAALARTYHIPCIAIAGSVGEELGDLYNMGIQTVFGFCPGPVSLEKAMK